MCIRDSPYSSYFPETSAGIFGSYLSEVTLPYLSSVGTTIVGAFFFMVSLSLLVNLHWQDLISVLKDRFINFIFYVLVLRSRYPRTPMIIAAATAIRSVRLL